MLLELKKVVLLIHVLSGQYLKTDIWHFQTKFRQCSCELLKSNVARIDSVKILQTWFQQYPSSADLRAQIIKNVFEKLLFVILVYLNLDKEPTDFDFTTSRL